jgi:hypothetical protein
VELLWDVCILQPKDTAPKDYNKLMQTPAGLEGDLNIDKAKKHPLFLAVLKAPAKSREQLAAEEEAARKHPLEAMWKTSSGDWQARVTGKVRARWLRGTYFPAPGKSNISGLLYTKPKAKPTDPLTYNFWGRYQDDSMKTNGVVDFKFDADLKKFDGEYSWSEFLAFLWRATVC